jgi:hypothetical protein
MRRVKASSVFTPGSFPTATYVERSERNYEQLLQDSLEVEGQVISVSGPSKSGKTVLVEKVVGQDNLVTVTGAGMESPDSLWDTVLDFLDVPDERSTATGVQGGIAVGAEAKGKAGIPLVAQGELTGSGEMSGGASREKAEISHRRGLSQVIELLSGSDLVLLIDDFHYMPRAVQSEISKQIKQAVRRGVKIVTASVPHRSDDVVRSNSELRGRVVAIDLDYWSTPYLRKIAELGFCELNVSLDEASINDFTTEASGSPQLMQAICLNSCFDLNIRERMATQTNLSPSKSDRRAIFSRTTSVTDFRSLVDVLDKGPRTRGTERKTFRFKDGTEGDVYRCVLKSIATDPPALSLSYSALQDRIEEICTGDQPVGSSVIRSCEQISALASDRFPKERVIEWDDSKMILDIPDPYFLFYLRWSDRLREPEDK